MSPKAQRPMPPGYYKDLILYCLVAFGGLALILLHDLINEDAPRTAAEAAARDGSFWTGGKHSEEVPDAKWVRLTKNLGDLSALDASGEAPLHIAVREAGVPMVTALLDRGANLHQLTGDGRGVLHLAALRGDKNVFELLVARGADINARDRSGWTPAHVAAAHHTLSIRLLRLLKQHGADLWAVDDKGRTVADLARVVQAKESAQWIEKYAPRPPATTTSATKAQPAVQEQN